ncbi:MAG: SDR family NAD(P)-dependent oxidoreductase, partial [Parahaliea sp.]
MELQNKVAIVSGAASGLGLATCKTLAAAGAQVIGLDLDQSRLNEAMAGGMVGMATDVADEHSARASVD